MIFILLPAYNESANIQPLLRSIESEAKLWAQSNPSVHFLSDIHVVVVNDGSNDTTGLETRSFQSSITVTLLEHETNRGLSAALKTGIDFIMSRGRDGDFVFTLDSDQTHHPRYLFQMISKLEQGYAIVVASRFAPGGKEVGVNPIRRLLSHGARRLYHLFFPSIPLRDFSCGYRGFSFTILKQTAARWQDRLFEAPGFACTGELMLKALAHTTPDRVTEIPFELHYEQKGGESKMPAMKTIMGTLSLLFKARSWMKSYFFS